MGEDERPVADGQDDIDELLDRVGFAAEYSVLTRRQAEVLALRERGLAQADIASRLGTSRANVSSIEASARTNVRKAHETVSFVETLRAPVRLTVPSGTDLYDVPELVYTACDDAGVKVDQPAPELMKQISDEAGSAIDGREIDKDLLLEITRNGDVRVRDGG